MQLGGSSKVLSGIKFVYLVAFFALLSGMFYPVITHTSSESVIGGVMILFVGLAGALTLYRAGTSDKHQRAYFIAGFAILGVATVLVYLILAKL